MEIITEYGPTILAALGAAVTLATIITAATPSKKDDAVVSKIRAALERLSLIAK